QQINPSELRGGNCTQMPSLTWAFTRLPNIHTIRARLLYSADRFNFLRAITWLFFVQSSTANKR
ncbi:hypothetical protein, partial [Yersinia kristensenii]|uniref:hypothetical protein n=1 Tax=Yersinia kristensenii TaxID=28152 RepID=UPI0022FE1FF1